MRAPARYGIAAMPQPQSAAQMLASALRTDLSGAQDLQTLITVQIKYQQSTSDAPWLHAARHQSALC